MPLRSASFIAIAGLMIGCAGTHPDQPRTINAADKSAVDAAMPTVSVIGVVDTVNIAGSTVTINFKDTQDSKFYAVVLGQNRDAVQQAFGGDLVKALTGKTIQVTGTVVLYRGRPEIVISKPDQLVIK